VNAIELAETFHRKGEWDYACGTALLRLLNIRPGMRVLEFGSATGRLAIDAAHLVAPEGEIIAMEPSEGRARFAKSIYRAGNVTFRVGGVKELAEMEEASLDMVYSNLLLHRLKSPDQAIPAVFRAISPGGVFAFTSPLVAPELIETLEMIVFGHDDFSSFIEASSGLAAWTLRPLEHWTGLVEEAGFSGVSFTPIVSELVLDSPRSLAAYWEAATDGSFLRGLPDRERELVLGHVDKQFQSLWGDRPLKTPVEVVAFQTVRLL
jgi:ubiquinone/menaquinone biosynthesis C-methylase UbiE